MNNEVQQLVIRLGWIFGVLSLLWFGAFLASGDMTVRNKCYAEGVAGLPQGVDQTLLQSQSNSYKQCLSSAVTK